MVRRTRLNTGGRIAGSCVQKTKGGTHGVDVCRTSFRAALDDVVQACTLQQGDRHKQAASCQAGAMLPTLRRVLALAAAFASLALGQAATAQGVYVPMPGSAPAATGPNLVNPSAPASSVNPNAFNPSAAPSAVMTPNALNPSATPSTFAPLLTEPGGERRILIGPVDPLYRIVPGSGRRRAARMRQRAQLPRQPHLRAPAPRTLPRAWEATQTRAQRARE